MKKYLFCFIGIMVLSLMITIEKAEASGDVRVSVINSEDGTAFDRLELDVAFFNPPGERVTVITNGYGEFEIDEKYIGDQIAPVSDGLRGEWTEVKEHGTELKVSKGPTLSH